MPHLPNNIWYQIANDLDIKSLCFFSQTSKKNHQLSRPLLQQLKVHVDMGRNFSLWYTAEQLYTCGYNADGQLGLGDNQDRTTFTQVTGFQGTIQKAIARDSHIFLLTHVGLYACGRNEYGELGLGDKHGHFAFTRVGGIEGTVREIVAGNKCTFVVTDRGLYASGQGDFGQLGLGNKKGSSVFIFVPGIEGKIQQVLTNDYNTLVLTDENLYACGHNGDGQLGLKDTENRSTFTPVPGVQGKIHQIALGTNSIFVLLTTKELYGCGLNNYGQLGLGDNRSRMALTLVPGLQGAAQQVVTGHYRSFILTDQHLYACGQHRWGELGVGHAHSWKDDSVLEFTAVEGLQGNVQQIITTGSNHNFILTDQALYACGFNPYGQLGLGDTENRHVFTPVLNIKGKVQQVVTNNIQTFVLSEENLYACGANNYGELGLGGKPGSGTPQINQPTPVQSPELIKNIYLTRQLALRLKMTKSEQQSIEEVALPSLLKR